MGVAALLFANALGTCSIWGAQENSNKSSFSIVPSNSKDKLIVLSAERRTFFDSENYCKKFKHNLSNKNILKSNILGFQQLGQIFITPQFERLSLWIRNDGNQKNGPEAVAYFYYKRNYIRYYQSKDSKNSVACEIQFAPDNQNIFEGPIIQY